MSRTISNSDDNNCHKIHEDPTMSEKRTKLRLSRAIGLGIIVAVGSGSAGAATATFGPDCDTVPPTPGLEACIASSTTGKLCIPVEGTSAMKICGTTTCSGDGTISKTPGAPNLGPCNVVGQTITASATASCVVAVTKDDVPIASETIGHGAGESGEICVRTTP